MLWSGVIPRASRVNKSDLRTRPKNGDDIKICLTISRPIVHSRIMTNESPSIHLQPRLDPGSGRHSTSRWVSEATHNRPYGEAISFFYFEFATANQWVFGGWRLEDSLSSRCVHLASVAGSNAFVLNDTQDMVTRRGQSGYFSIWHNGRREEFYDK